MRDLCAMSKMHFAASDQFICYSIPICAGNGAGLQWMIYSSVVPSPCCRCERKGQSKKVVRHPLNAIARHFKYPMAFCSTWKQTYVYGRHSAICLSYIYIYVQGSRMSHFNPTDFSSVMNSCLALIYAWPRVHI